MTWHAEDCVIADGKTGEKTRVYTGCDGVMVPIITDAEKIKRRDRVKAKRRRSGKKCKPLPPRKRGSDLSWKEFKVAFFYSEDAKRQHVAFTHGNHIATGRLLRREADRLRFQQADQRVGLVDGATWIREQMQLHFAELDALGLDFYHLSENVHRARRKVFGEESPEGKTWADELMHAFKHDGYSAAWERILSWRTTLRGKAKREPADRLLNFVSARRNRSASYAPNDSKATAAAGTGPTLPRLRPWIHWTGTANGAKSGQTPVPSRLKVAKNAGHTLGLASGRLYGILTHRRFPCCKTCRLMFLPGETPLVLLSKGLGEVAEWSKAPVC